MPSDLLTVCGDVTFASSGSNCSRLKIIVKGTSIVLSGTGTNTKGNTSHRVTAPADPETALRGPKPTSYRQFKAPFLWLSTWVRSPKSAEQMGLHLVCKILGINKSVWGWTGQAPLKPRPGLLEAKKILARWAARQTRTETQGKRVNDWMTCNDTTVVLAEGPRASGRLPSVTRQTRRLQDKTVSFIQCTKQRNCNGYNFRCGSLRVSSIGLSVWQLWFWSRGGNSFQCEGPGCPSGSHFLFGVFATQKFGSPSHEVCLEQNGKTI